MTRSRSFFVARLDRGDQGGFLYTPEASFRPTEPLPSGAGGSWDARKDRRFGQLPQAVHRVRLFAKQDLTIDGPAKPTTIEEALQRCHATRSRFSSSL
jgi:hypothetical protein